MRQRVVWIALISLCAVLAGAALSAEAALTITAPAANGDTIAGTYTFTVATPPAGTASVEFRLPSYLIGDAPCVDKTMPYACTWNTGFGLDGYYGLEAVARDAYGTILETATRYLNINNHGITLALTLMSAGTIDAPISGFIGMQFTVVSGTYYPSNFTLAVDGREIGLFDCESNYGDPMSHSCVIGFTFATYLFADGLHELKIIMSEWAEDTPPHSYPHTFQYVSGMWLRNVTFSNGATKREVVANVQHGYLQPTQTLPLTCATLFTDNTRGACVTPGYVSSDPTVATVSAGGLVTAVAEGFTTITLTASDFPVYLTSTTTVLIWVRGNLDIPHFSGSGAILAHYNPATSVFPKAIFSSDTIELSTTPTFYDSFIKAGARFLSFNFFYHPHDMTMPYLTWKALQDSNVGAQLAWLVAHGFYGLLNGDAAVSPPGYSGAEIFNWPAGEAAFKYAVAQAAASGAVVGFEMADEGGGYIFPVMPAKIGTTGAAGVGFDAPTSVVCTGSVCTVHWSASGLIVAFIYNGGKIAFQGSLHPELNTPPGTLFTVSNVTATSFDFTPNSPITITVNNSNDPDYEVLYFAWRLCGIAVCNPFLPNNAVGIFSGWVSSVTPHPPFSWPIVGNYTPAAAATWIGKAGIDNGVSTYASEFWIGVGLLQAAYPWSKGIQVATSHMRDQFYTKQPAFYTTAPQFLYTCASSYIYFKNVADRPYYTPPGDTLVEPGCDGPMAQAEQFAAVALGVAGVRQYYLDLPPAIRAAYLPVGYNWPSGFRPDAPREGGLEVWEALGYSNNLIDQVLKPYALATPMASPAYERGLITAVRQGSDAQMLLIVNGNDMPRTLVVDFTPYRSGQPIAKYVVAYNSLQTTRLPDGAGETVILPRGGTVAYVFPFGSSTNPLQAGTVTPALPLGAASAVVDHNHIYGTHLAQHTGGVACTPSCTFRVDPRLGEVWVQTTYLDGGGAVVSRDAPVLLSLDLPTPTPIFGVKGQGVIFALP